jgi:hypothetical protein
MSFTFDVTLKAKILSYYVPRISEQDGDEHAVVDYNLLLVVHKDGKEETISLEDYPEVRDAIDNELRYQHGDAVEEAVMQYKMTSVQP